MACVVCGSGLANAKYLPCGHEYCGSPKDCLKKMEQSDGRVKCAECEEEFNFTADDFTKSQDHTDDISRLSRIDLWTREYCEKHNSWIDWFCHDCQEKVCKKCWKEGHIADYHHDVEYLEFTNQKYFLEKMKKFNIEARKALLEYQVAVIDKMLSQLGMYGEKFDQEVIHLQEATEAARNLPSAEPANDQTNPYEQPFDPNHPVVVAYMKIHAEENMKIFRPSCFRKSDLKNLLKVADYLPQLYGKGRKLISI